MKYSIGDNVRILATESAPLNTIGNAGIIIEAYSGGQEYYELDNGWCYDVSELELASPCKPKRTRGFERIKGYDDISLPTRGTRHSAGYDIATPVDIIIAPNATVVIPTGIKAYMQDNEFLGLYVRSSIGKLGLAMVTGVSVIDSDYYENPDNDGHIFVMLRNDSSFDIDITKGTRLVQGIFHGYLCTDDDNVTTARVGGVGSSGV